jgi:hypothetical protein
MVFGLSSGSSATFRYDGRGQPTRPSAFIPLLLQTKNLSRHCL